jgi:hypothetical protein
MIDAIYNYLISLDKTQVLLLILCVQANLILLDLGVIKRRLKKNDKN